jgi:hypothetical protein
LFYTVTSELKFEKQLSNASKGESMTDRQKVRKYYVDMARLDRNMEQPAERRYSIYVGERQISDQCATSSKAWASAWEKIRGTTHEG